LLDDGSELFVSGPSEAQMKIGKHHCVGLIVQGLSLIDKGDEVRGCDGIFASFTEKFGNFDVLVFEHTIGVVDDHLGQIH
jgi:hypothetical protein